MTEIKLEKKVMNDKPVNNNIIDTTDCLEAINAFKGMKNFLFIVILLCLLLLQGIFWLNNTGLINKSKCPCKSHSQMCLNPTDTENSPDQPEAEPAAAADPVAESVANPVAEPAAEPEPDNTIEERAKEVTANLDAEEPTNTEKTTTTAKLPKIFTPRCKHIAAIVRACNFVLVISATLYCLTLLISIKISLAGRLGGISHISRAFFFSLFVLVILMPWQFLLPGMVTGTIYTPKELLWNWDTSGGSIALYVLYYLRFVGLWLITLLLLICAQLRTGRWSRTTLRRLGIVK